MAADAPAVTSGLIRISEDVAALLKKVDGLQATMTSGGSVDVELAGLDSRFVQVKAEVTKAFTQFWATPPAPERDSYDLTARVAALEDAWRDVEGTWTGRRAIDLALVAARAQALKAMLALSLALTMPIRIDAKLTRLSVGDALDLKSHFQTAGPADLLTAEFARLGTDTNVRGLVTTDPVQPRVFKVHPRVEVRLLTWMAPPLVGILGYVLVWGADRLELLPQLQPELTRGGAVTALTLGYAGALLHLLITGLKETRRTAGGTETPALTAKWMLWLHVKYIDYIYSVIAVIVATALALRVTPVDPPSSTWLLFVTAGYSADSVLDTFVSKVPGFFQSRSARSAQLPTGIGAA